MSVLYYAVESYRRGFCEKNEPQMPLVGLSYCLVGGPMFGKINMIISDTTFEALRTQNVVTEEDDSVHVALFYCSICFNIALM